MKSIVKPMITITLVLGSIMTFIVSQNHSQSVTNDINTKKSANEMNVVPFFIANNGQIDENIKFYVKGNQHSFFLKASGEAVTRSIYKEKEETTEKSNGSLPGIDTAHAKTVREVAFAQSFVGANKGVLPQAGERAVPTLNFFTNNKKITEVPTYNTLTYKNLYNGIDLTYRVSDQKQVKYDLIVAPGVDPHQIIMKFDGIENLSVDDAGNLVMKTPAQAFTQHKPYVYQVVDGVEQPVEGSYQVNAPNNTVAFAIGVYDRNFPLIIDPVLDQLGASTLYGGSGVDEVRGITKDSSNRIFVTGYTLDDTTDLPVISGGYDTTHNGGYDAFVARFDSNVGTLTYATYIGGSGTDYGMQIKLDTNGKVIIAGDTTSGTEFPTTTSAYASSSAGTDIFISRFSADLASLEVSTRFGGTDTDVLTAMYVDSSNNTYVAGYTSSTNFVEVTGNYDSSFGGNIDAFVGKLPSNLSSLEATYLGGTGIDESLVGIMVDSSGNIYVGGYTYSTDFPTTASVYDTSYNSGQDGFISKFSSDLTSLSASTFIGTSGDELLYDLALDSNGAIYAGLHQTSGSGLETTASVLQTSAGGGYIAKLNSSLTSSGFIGTYFGGTGSDTKIRKLILDSSNVVYVAGEAGSSFTTISGAYDTSFNGGTDAFVSKITANLQTLSESTYIGGSGNDYIFAMTLNADQDNVFVGGRTADASTDYPTTGSAYDTTHNGSIDAFITILGAIAGGGGQGGGGGSSTPEFSTFMYMTTLLWCLYLLYKKLNPQSV